MVRRATADEYDGNSSISSRPLLIEGGEVVVDGPAGADGVSSDEIRRGFHRMSTLFAVNHGCTVSCVGLAKARLGSVGVWQSGTLYASYTAAALFGAPWLAKRLGSRNGLALGLGASACYVASFFLASLSAESEEVPAWSQGVVTICGALVGGLGSSTLWVSQGAYFSSASRLFASKEGEMVEDVTGRFGGSFAFVFLSFEVLMKLLSTFLIETAGLPWKIIFGLYSLLSILPAIFMMGVLDLEGHQVDCTSISEYGRSDDEDVVSPTRKAAATLDLLRKDPKTKYLSPLSILFGLSMAFSTSVFNGEVIQKVLSDPNSTYVGFYTAITSMVAAGASLLFGILQSSHGSLHVGKGLILSAGALSYLIIAIGFIAAPNSNDWNHASLMCVYALLGVGRATYEGTLRAIFADFFPDEKEGAFGNIILFSGTASTVGYALSVCRALQCEETSAHCMEYSDGSIHNVFLMELFIIVAAIVAIPAFWIAVWLFRKEQRVQNSTASRPQSHQEC